MDTRKYTFFSLQEQVWTSSKSWPFFFDSCFAVLLHPRHKTYQIQTCERIPAHAQSALFQNYYRVYTALTARNRWITRLDNTLTTQKESELGVSHGVYVLGFKSWNNVPEWKLSRSSGLRLTSGEQALANSSWKHTVSEGNLVRHLF